jgi:hypothetical protein
MLIDKLQKEYGTPGDDDYSILNDLGEKDQLKSAKKFLFKLLWPKKKGVNYNIWKQSSNPMTKKQGGVEGYEAVDVRFTMGSFGGL